MLDKPTTTGYYWASWEGVHVRTVAYYDAIENSVRVVGSGEVYSVEDLHDWVRIPNEEPLAFS